MTESSTPPGVGPTPVFLELVELLDAGSASYRIIEHPAAGKSEEVALIRGTEVGQGANAMACRLQMKRPYRGITTIADDRCSRSVGSPGETGENSPSSEAVPISQARPCLCLDTNQSRTRLFLWANELLININSVANNQFSCSMCFKHSSSNDTTYLCATLHGNANHKTRSMRS